MLRLHKLNTTSKRGERVHFRLSNFQLLRVPEGCDSLFLSVISIETGKLLTELGKTRVQNGNCQWMETVSESLWIPQNGSSQEAQESLIKLVVSTGMGRYDILGEVTINMSQYKGATLSTEASQPLNKCSYGTILQVKIQSLPPRSKVRSVFPGKIWNDSSDDSCRNEDLESTNSENENQKEENHDIQSNSNDSDDSNHLRDVTDGPLSTCTPHLLKLERKLVSLAEPDWQGSYESLEEEIMKGDLSFSKDDVKSEKYTPRGKRVDGSYENDFIPDNHSVHDKLSSNCSSLSSRLYLSADSQNGTTVATSSASIFSSSRNLLEAAEDTIEELHAESKTWKRNARILATDLDVSRREFSDLSRQKIELDVQLSSAYVENDGLKREIEKLKLELQEDSRFQYENLLNMQKILENEMKYHQDLNADLGEQLKQSQESNIQLVSVLRELEEIIEQQRAEIDSLSSLKRDPTDLENEIHRISEENEGFLMKLQKLQESEKTLQADTQSLEQAVKDKTDELVNAERSHKQSLFNVERDYKAHISRKEKEIARLEENLSFHVSDKSSKLTEIKSLREKVQELEKDCTELKDELVELLLKRRKCPSFGSNSSDHAADCPCDGSEESDPKSQIFNLDDSLEQNANGDIQNDGFEGSQQFVEISKRLEETLHILTKPWYGIMSHENEVRKNYTHELMNAIQEKETAEYVCSFLHELNALLESRIAECEDTLRGHEIDLEQVSTLLVEAERKMEGCVLEVENHEKEKVEALNNCAKLTKELEKKTLQVDLIEGENKFLIQRKMELESEITKLHQEKRNLEQNVEFVLGERNATSECVRNLQNDVSILRNCVDSHACANTILERQSEELESEKEELGNSLLALQEENLQFQECIFDLEAQIRSLKDESESLKKETDSFKSSVTSLRDEMQKQKGEMDREMSNMKQKSEDMKKHWLEAEKQCESLKEDNQTLQASAATSAQKNIKLQNSNMKLSQENQKLHQSISEMVVQLTKSRECLADLTKKVELLEDHLDSVLKDFNSREDCLKSEVDALLQEIGNQEEKIALRDSVNQEVLEMTFKYENLIEIEMKHLNKQISDVKDEKERISSEAANEVSRLRAEKSEIQFLLQEAKSNAELMKNTLNEIHLKSESKFKVFTDQLAASQQSHEILLADHERTLKLLENYKKGEEKLMTGINDLELKLTVSDYERQQLTKKLSMLKVQLQNKSSDLQGEISILKDKLKECSTEKSLLEQSVQMENGNCQEMKMENVLPSEKNSTFQVALSEHEEVKREKLVLKEKLQQIEHDASEFHTQNSSVKSKLAEVRRANRQFGKDECFKKAQSNREELELMAGSGEIREEGEKDGNNLFGHPFSIAAATKLQPFEGNSKAVLNAKNSHGFYHDRFISSDQNSSRVSSKKSALDGVVTRKIYDRTKSDLRERYLQMSLKYAEVEAHR